MGSACRRSRGRSRARSSPSWVPRPALGRGANPAAAAWRSAGPGSWSPRGPRARIRRRASGLTDSVQDPARRRRKAGREPVERPDTALGDFDEPGLAQPGHVVRHRWLRKVERRGEVADAHGLPRVAKDEGHLEPGGIRERLEDCAGVFKALDRKSTRLNSSHLVISYAVFCLKK